MIKISWRLRFVLLITFSAATTFAAADEWEFTLGVGVADVPVYEGAGDRFVTPFPTVEVEYNHGPFEIIGSLSDGLELSYFSSRLKTFGGISLRQGISRDSDGYQTLFGCKEYEADNRSLLKESASLKETYELDTSFGILMPIGVLGATLGYRPTESTLNNGVEIEEHTYQGMVFSLFYGVAVPINWRINVEAAVSLQGMNNAYAEAWYSVPESAVTAPEFTAEAGLQLTRIVVKGTYLLTPNIGLSLQVMEAVLLGDARISPYVENPAQMTILAGVFYRF